MRKIWAILTAGIFLFGITGIAGATTISFVTQGNLSGLLGVDSPTPVWSTNNTTKNLGVAMWNLLGGTAQVTGYTNYPQMGNLTHRGTRGLGVHTGEWDEVDNPDSIIITFDQPHYLNYLEVRSLFFEPMLGGREEGDVFGYLNNSLTFTQHLVGVENIYTPGTDGSLEFTYLIPSVIDTLEFTVLSGKHYTNFSEFAVAKLEVAPVPEPAGLVLLGSFSLGIVALSRVKKLIGGIA